MSDTYPLEAKLRRPYEWASASTAAIAAGVTVVCPDWLMLPLPAALPLAAGLLALSVLRAKQGWSIVSYQRNLRRLPRYVISAADIPWSHEALFMGMGFYWDQRHSQRLADTRLPQNRRYCEMSWLYRKARDLERQWEHTPEQNWLGQPRAHWIQRMRQDVWWNPVAPLPDIGGDPALHGVEPNETALYTALANRVGHMCVLGTTRVGKTRFAEVVITQDIRRGDVVIVFDPKGDVALLRRMYAEAKRSGRADQFSVFHLGYPEISARYNPVGQYSRVTEVASRTAGPLPDEGQSSAFRQFVWRYVNVLARAMNALGERPDYQAIYAHAVNTEPLATRYLEQWLDTVRPLWRTEYSPTAVMTEKALQAKTQKTNRTPETVALITWIQLQEIHDPIGDALISILSNDRTYFEKLVSSLYPLLEKLTTGKMAETISPDYDNLDDPRPIIDWHTIISQGGIVYIGLDSLSDSDVAAAVGNAMFADLTSVAGYLYKHGASSGQSQKGNFKRLCLHADEFNELVGDEFIPMVNKAGGAGYCVTAYTQTSSDLEAKIGSTAKAKQIFGNFNTRVMFRVEDEDTATILTSKLSEVELASVVASSSASDTNDPSDFAEFGSKNEDRISMVKAPMITPADLVQLPKGQAFCLIDGGQLIKIRVPLFDEHNDAFMPPTLAHMVQEMAARQRSGKKHSALIVEGKGSGW